MAILLTFPLSHLLTCGLTPVAFADRGRFNQGDLDGFVGAGLDAGGRFAGREPAAAHVALADDAETLRILRHVVGAFQHAVLAANTLIIKVLDDAGNGIFFVGKHRAAVEALRIDAVMAGGGDGLLNRLKVSAAVQQPDAAPRLLLLQAVQAVAGSDAGFAAGTLVELHFKGVLLAGLGLRERDEVAVMPGLGGQLMLLMRAREFRHGGQ